MNKILLGLCLIFSSQQTLASVSCTVSKLKKISCEFKKRTGLKKEDFSISAFKADKRIPAPIKKKITSQYYQKHQIPSEK